MKAVSIYLHFQGFYRQGFGVILPDDYSPVELEDELTLALQPKINEKKVFILGIEEESVDSSLIKENEVMTIRTVVEIIRSQVENIIAAIEKTLKEVEKQ